MVVPASIAMAPTSAPALMATPESTARIWCAGVTPRPVRMEDLVGSKELRTPVSVRLAGPAFTVTSPVYLVK